MTKKSCQTFQKTGEKKRTKQNNNRKTNKRAN